MISGSDPEPGSLKIIGGQTREEPNYNLTAIMATTKGAENGFKTIKDMAGKGASLEQVLKTTVFLVDMGDFAAMNAVYAEFFTSAPPARSTVQVSRLPRDVRVEIEAIAVRG